MSLALTPAVAELFAAAGRATVDDKLLLADEEILDDIRALVTAQSRIMIVVVRRAFEAYAADASTTVAGKAVRSWLVEDLLMPRQVANKVMLLAHHLNTFPTIAAAWQADELTFEQTVAAVQTLLQLPSDIRATATEHVLRYACGGSSPAEISKFGDELLEGMGYDKTSDLNREMRYASRGVSLVETMDGERDLKGRLDPVGGAIVEEALRVAGEQCEGDNRTLRQANHDALVEISRHYLEHVGAQPKFTGSPVGVMVVVPLEVLEERVNTASAMLLPSRARIGPDTARRLACDATLIPMVLGTKSEVLDVGRSARDFPPGIRRAAYVEQGGHCAFPRCRRKVVECHHIVWWRSGGKTALDNAVWLCAYHHWLVHEGKWSMRRNADRSFTFISPAGVERHRHLEAA